MCPCRTRTFPSSPAFPFFSLINIQTKHKRKQTIVNTTTLGNAALYPTTTLGRIVSCVVAYTGLLAIALPISIVYVRSVFDPFFIVYVCIYKKRWIKKI